MAIENMIKPTKEIMIQYSDMQEELKQMRVSIQKTS